LIDYGSSTMKATDSKIIIATGDSVMAYSPRLQVINLLPDDKGHYNYEVQTFDLDISVDKIVDII